MLRGNYIGTNSSDNEDIGNFSYGIHIKDTSGVKIGGIEEDQGITIAFNGSIREQRGHGIVIEGGTKNAIRRNSIFENSGRGIDLVDENFPGATPYAFNIPDASEDLNGDLIISTSEDSNGNGLQNFGDHDTGSNELQNYPVVTDVKFGAVHKP